MNLDAIKEEYTKLKTERDDLKEIYDSAYEAYQEGKEEMDNIKAALKMAKSTGYGIVYPTTKELKLNTIGLVNQEKLGMYQISYETSYHNKKYKDTRLVKVIDATKPEITLNKEVTACEKNNKIY